MTVCLSARNIESLARISVDVREVLTTIQHEISVAAVRRGCDNVCSSVSVETAGISVSSWSIGQEVVVVRIPLLRHSNHAVAVGAGRRLSRLWHRSSGSRLELTKSRGSCSSLTVVVFRDLALDASAVRSGADRWKNVANAIDKGRLHILTGKVHSCLHDVICKPITQQLLEGVWSHDLADDVALGIWSCAADALLDYVRAELLAGQQDNVRQESSRQRLGEARLSKIEDVLHHIVAKGILDKLVGIGDDMVYHLALLQPVRMVNASLQDAATMTVSADYDAVVADSLEDEAGILG